MHTTIDARAAWRAAPAELTPREREVAALLAAGFTKSEVGERLFISPNTVNRHAVNLMAKLGVHNRAALALAAIRAGLVNA